MSIGPRERTGDKMLAWSFAAALVLGLVALLVATSESLRRLESAVPVTGAAEAYHGAGDAAWPVP